MRIKPTRREFIAGGVGAGLSIPLLRSTRAPRWLQGLTQTGASLVVVQLRGGNDPLQTLAPLDDPIYAKARPTIGLPKAKSIQLQANTNLYLHPAAKPFKDLFDRGDLAAVVNVGYNPANLSHFRSEDIWAAADPSAVTVNKGWMASYLDTYPSTVPIQAMNQESRLNDAFVGHPVPVFGNPAQFLFRFDPRTANDDTVELQQISANANVLRPTADPNLKFVTSAISGTVSDVDTIQKTGATYKPAATYPTGSSATDALVRSLQTAARYIIGGLGAEVYWTSTGGFDLHANMVVQGAPETGNQATLLDRLSSCIKAFLDDVKAQGKGKEVIVFVFSEFGRRLGENGALGVDHGKGGVSFFAGEPVQGGAYGSYPDLSKVVGSNTNYNRINSDATTDFRSMYATILDKWFKADHTKVLGQKFPYLSFL